MDSKTTVQELKERIKFFCEERDWDQFHDAKELSIGIITEASELLEHFRFKSKKEVEDLFDDESKQLDDMIKHNKLDPDTYVRMKKALQLNINEKLVKIHEKYNSDNSASDS